MLAQYLQSVTGIEHLGIAFLIAAVALFAGVVVYVVRLDKATLQSMAALPLESDPAQSEGPEGRVS